MTLTEILLATMLFAQSVAWLITDYSRFDDGETNE